MSSKSSSQANQTQQTTNVDKRIANESGIVLSAEGSSVDVNVESLDGDIVRQALQTVQMSDAVQGEGFDRLLSTVDKIVVGAGDALERTQQGLLNAYTNAQTEKTGAIDQKTMIVLAVAAAATMIAISTGKRA